jgi:hypothetical protein
MDLKDFLDASSGVFIDKTSIKFVLENNTEPDSFIEKIVANKSDVVFFIYDITSSVTDLLDDNNVKYVKTNGVDKENNYYDIFKTSFDGVNVQIYASEDVNEIPKLFEDFEAFGFNYHDREFQKYNKENNLYDSLNQSDIIELSKKFLSTNSFANSSTNSSTNKTNMLEQVKNKTVSRVSKAGTNVLARKTVKLISEKFVQLLRAKEVDNFIIQLIEGFLSTKTGQNVFGLLIGLAAEYAAKKLPFTALKNKRVEAVIEAVQDNCTTELMDIATTEIFTFVMPLLADVMKEFPVEAVRVEDSESSEESESEAKPKRKARR